MNTLFKFLAGLVYGLAIIGVFAVHTGFLAAFAWRCFKFGWDAWAMIF